MWKLSNHFKMEIFASVIQGERWLWLVCLGAKHLSIQHCAGESYFCTLQVVECCAINEHGWFEYLLWFMCGNHKSGYLCYMTMCMCLHSCLLGCVCWLLACWLGCHILLGGRGITKVCAIRLQPRGEHMLSSWPLGNLCLLFNVKI